MAELTVQDLAPGVAAALGGVCNRGIISGGGSVLVVDSGYGPAEAQPLRAAAEARLGKGYLALFNTHEHGDHTFGNQIFADCPIIAQDAVRTVLAERGTDVLAAWKQNPQMTDLIGDAQIALPTVTFAERQTLYLGEMEVQLIRVGPAHSQGDAFAWLPGPRVLFTGDILFNSIVPAMPLGGNSATWVRALEYAETLGAAQVVPGHGPIEPPAALGQLRSWIITVRARVAESITDGLDRAATVARVGPAMQAALPRGREERLPSAIGQVFDDIARERRLDVQRGA
jgi:cyclase